MELVHVYIYTIGYSAAMMNDKIMQFDFIFDLVGTERYIERSNPEEERQNQDDLTHRQYVDNWISK